MNLLSTLFLVSHGANSLIGAILIITTFRLYLKTKIQLVSLMTILMTSWSVTNFLLIVPLLFDGFSVVDGIPSVGVSLIASWNIVGSAIVPVVFIIFIDAFEGEVDVRKVSVAIATLVTAIFISIIGLTQNNVEEISSTIVVVEGLITMRWSPIASLAIFPTVLACGVWTQRELQKSKIHAIDIKQIRQINFMRIGGIFMFYIGPLFGIAGVVAVDGFNEPEIGTYLSEIIGYLFVSIGIFMMTLAYTTTDAVAFLQPQRIDSLISIFSTGIPVFQYDFSPQEEQKPDVSLISGAITAITAIMGEAFNVTSDVKQIAFHDKELILHFEKLEIGINIAFVLITDRKSTFLETSLSRFSKQFANFLPPETIDGIQLNENQYNEAALILRQSFGLASLKM